MFMLKVTCKIINSDKVAFAYYLYEIWFLIAYFYIFILLFLFSLFSILFVCLYSFMMDIEFTLYQIN